MGKTGAGSPAEKGNVFRTELHTQRLSLEVGVNVTFLKVTVKMQCP